MKILIASDLHFEFHQDGGGSILEALPQADVFVCAGDLSNASGIESALRMVCKKYDRVVFVCGNHEFYGGDIPSVRRKLENLSTELEGLYYLDNKVAVIDGVRFVGSTLWFKDSPEVRMNFSLINDFSQINRANVDIFSENESAIRFLNKNVTRDSIVVTHHLPSFSCVDKNYKNSPMNCFFVCNMDNLISEEQPRLWIHGHTHSSVDKKLGDTRVVANTLGYPFEINKDFNVDFVLEYSTGFDL